MQEIVITWNDSTLTATRADGVSLASACADSHDALSATQLLAASLGSCVAASLVPLLSRHGADPAGLCITLRGLGDALEQGFALIIALPPVDDALRQRCERAARACPVRRALAVPVDIRLEDH